MIRALICLSSVSSTVLLVFHPGPLTSSRLVHLLHLLYFRNYWIRTFRITDLGVRSEVRIPPLITYLQNFQISVFLQENYQTSQYRTDMVRWRALILWDTLHCWRALILCFDTMYNYYPCFRVKHILWDFFYTVEFFFI